MTAARLVAAVLFLLAPVAVVQAQATWQATLQPAQGRPAHTPTGALRIDLPAAADAQARSRLSLEVDAIDVTALAQIGSTGIVFTPPQALAAGSHHMRLVEYDDSGTPLEHGAWTFTVASEGGSAGAVAAAGGATRRVATQLRADVALGGAWRVADHNLPTLTPARFSSDASASLGMITQGARWRTETVVELTHAGPAATAGAVNPGAAGNGQDSVQLGQFSVMAQSEVTRFMLGDQSLPYNGLVVSGLARRGVSGDVKIDPLRARVGVFSMRSDAISGFGHGLGVGDPRHRVSGIVFDTHPLGDVDALGLTFAYAGGRGAPDGTATYLPFATAPSGRAMGLDVDSQLFGRQLHLHAGAAHSTYDFGVPSLPRRSDNARSALVSYQPAAVGGATVSSQTSLSYQSTGTYFRALANPGITPDLTQWQLSQSLNGSMWSLQGNFGLDVDNVGDNPMLATVYTRRLQLTGGLFPTPAEHPGAFARLIGTPYYSLSLDASRSRNGHLPDPKYLRTDLDMSTVNASAQFSHTRWNWNLGLLFGSNTDHTGQQTSTRMRGVTLGANVTLGDGGNVGGAVQLSDTRDRSGSGRSRDTSYNLYASNELVPGRLSSQINFSITRTAQAIQQFVGTPQPGASYDTRTTSGSLLWHALPARPNRPGLDFSLSGVWNHGGYPTVGGMPALPSDTWQIFLKVDVVLPLRHPGGTP